MKAYRELWLTSRPKPGAAAGSLANMKRWLGALWWLPFVTGVLCFASPAQAQEVRLTGPLAGASAMPLTRAHWHDGSVWAALGASILQEQNTAFMTALGAQLTFGAARLSYRTQLRWGPWGQMMTDGTGGRAEGGLLAQLFQRAPSRISALDVRIGAGSGKDAAGVAPHWSVTITAGPRYFEEPSCSSCRPDDAPLLLLGWRLFASARSTFEREPVVWLAGGIEMELGVVNADEP